MKRKTAGVLVLAYILQCLVFGTVYGDDLPITIWINDVQVETDAEPVQENDRTLVPLRAIFEQLGAEVDWDEETWTAVVEMDGITIEAAVDQPVMKKNGEEILLDVPPRLIGERTMVPVRAISEGLGADVDWDEPEQKVRINYPKAPEQPAVSPMPTAEPSKAPESAAEPTAKAEELIFSQRDIGRMNSDSQYMYADFRYELYQSMIEDHGEEIIQLFAGGREDEILPYVEAVWNQTFISRAEKRELDFEGERTEAVYRTLQEQANLLLEQVYTVTIDELDEGQNYVLLESNDALNPRSKDRYLLCAYDEEQGYYYISERWKGTVFGIKCTSRIYQLSEKDTVLYLYDIPGLDDTLDYFLKLVKGRVKSKTYSNEKALKVKKREYGYDLVDSYTDRYL